MNEFTVAPMINPPEGGLPYHEWLVEFETEPEAIGEFAERLDQSLQQQNSYLQEEIKSEYNFDEIIGRSATTLSSYRASRIP